MASSNVDAFLKHIMSIQVLRAGGASAGILGSSGADNDVVNSLKKSAVAFAGEYRKPTASPDELERLAQEIDGFLQTLQITSTLSEEKAGQLITELEALMNPPSDR